MTNSNQPYIILVEPQLAENVGMAASHDELRPLQYAPG